MCGSSERPTPLQFALAEVHAHKLDCFTRGTLAFVPFLLQYITNLLLPPSRLVTFGQIIHQSPSHRFLVQRFVTCILLVIYCSMWTDRASALQSSWIELCLSPAEPWQRQSEVGSCRDRRNTGDIEPATLASVKPPRP